MDSVFLVVTKDRIKAFSTWEGRDMFVRRFARMSPAAVSREEPGVCFGCGREHEKGHAAQPIVRGFELVNATIKTFTRAHEHKRKRIATPRPAQPSEALR